MKVKNEQGQEVEVFTKEEAEALAKEQAEKASGEAAQKAADEAVERYKEEHPDQTAQIQDLQTKLDDAQKSLDNTGGDDGQKKRLLEERDEARRKLQEVTDGVSKRLEEIEKRPIQDQKDELLDRLAQGDKDLRKKIEYEFDNYKPNETSRDAIIDRMEKAARLAGVSATSGVMDNISSAGARGESYKADTPKEASDNEKKIGAALGVSNEDREKYANDPRLSKNKSSE